MEEEARITLRLPARLHEQLKDAIKTSRRSLNSEIVFLLEYAIRLEETKK